VVGDSFQEGEKTRWWAGWLISTGGWRWRQAGGAQPNGEAAAAWLKVGGDDLLGLHGLQGQRSHLG
jgi:hypothetical protein